LKGYLTNPAANPNLRPLFEGIARFHVKSQHSLSNDVEVNEPAAKKRKLENGSAATPSSNDTMQTAKVEFQYNDVSFQIPQRKKFHFQIRHSGSAAFFVGAGTATSDAEFALSNTNVSYILRLPVPEKAQKQLNYLFLARSNSGEESILFTVPAGGTENLDEAIKKTGLSITEPAPAEFASAIPEAHRKNEKAYHVKAFRGSKDGFLFFLSTGIFFGFKKPLFFVNLEDVQSVAYTSVLQRTFNIVITFKEDGSDDEKDVEFSMLDQADYAGINDYVQRHGLNDASLAASRKAKMVGKDKKQTVSNGDVKAEEDDGRTELEKAEQQLQDEEDEEEEDFDPGSDDDSDGSGESDEYDGDEDLVQQELGSEAEDVSVDEEDEDDGEEEEEPIEEVKPAPQPIAFPTRPANEPDPEDDDQL
jgi:hypothetical protein